MKSIIRKYLYSAVLMIGTAMMLTACADNDTVAWNNPLSDKIYGLWYADYQASGTVGVDNVQYDRVVQAVQLNSDGTGTWWKALFSADDASKPLYLYGGRYPLGGSFDYTVAADGTITAKREGEKQTDGSPMTLVFHYANGRITTDDGGVTQALKPAPKDFDNVLLQLENSLQGAEAENFNINDGDITAENWRQQEAIYIYDGKGVDVQDSKGRTGYSLVNLPWYEGTKLTNLPADFCKDMTPDNGWEWIVNYCGNRSIANNNFFAVYNKYTGILRFFYYLPEGFSTGNDHVWQVSMTDNLATRTTIPYGVPADRKLSNKAAINQTGQGTFMDYITPWTDYRSNDGLIVPNAGWWAFDVDLSLTRPEALAEDNVIKLQMRSWETQHSSLFSTMAANIDGTMKGTFEAQTTGSISMVSNAKGITGMLGQLGGPAGDVVSSFMSGDYKSALGNAVSLASGAYNLSSGKPLKNPGVEGNVNLHTVGEYEGVINLLMNGTINTDGIISGSQPTVGIASPTFYLKDFDTQNSHLGQGVWNLKKSPVVYAINSKNLVDYYRRPAPPMQGWDEGCDTISAGNWMFFDPSSVEVELNPNVFPEEDIEWMQVDAVSVLRKVMGWNGTDPFRQAIGLKPFVENTYKIEDINNELFSSIDYGQETNNYVFNFAGAGKFDGQTIEGTTFRVDYGTYKTSFTVPGGVEYSQLLHLFGCGTDSYIIEPQLTCVDRHPTSGEHDPETGKNVLYNSVYLGDLPYYYPAAEINVTVTVKLKSVEAPIVLSRTYLPDCQFLQIKYDETKVLETIDRILSKKNLSSKTAGHTESYDFQATRINKCFQLLTGFSR